MGARKDRDVKKTKEQVPMYSISNCRFSAVEWDKSALETVQTVARALLNLTELFKSQNVTVETMIKIGPEGPPKTP